MSKERRNSAFFGQQNKEETAQTSAATDEAEPEENQLSETKSKLPKKSTNQSAVRSTKGYALFALPKKSNPFTKFVTLT